MKAELQAALDNPDRPEAQAASRATPASSREPALLVPATVSLPPTPSPPYRRLHHLKVGRLSLAESVPEYDRWQTAK